jgi:hypothetical protein
MIACGATRSNKGMKLTKLSPAPWPDGGAGSCPRRTIIDAGTASQLIPSVRPTWTNRGSDVEANGVGPTDRGARLRRDLFFFRSTSSSGQPPDGYGGSATERRHCEPGWGSGGACGVSRLCLKGGEACSRPRLPARGRNRRLLVTARVRTVVVEHANGATATGRTGKWSSILQTVGSCRGGVRRGRTRR